MLEDKLFNPEWDAQTLAEAAAINENPARLAAASEAAGEMIDEAEAKAQALKGIQKKLYGHPSSVAAREERETGKKSA